MKIKSAIIGISVRIINKLLYPIDKIACRYIIKADVPSPIFIIGPPRSGSTLLYQTLTDRYNFAYFTNFSAKFYNSPVLPTLALKSFFPSSPQGKYNSYHGNTNGLFGPNECGAFWYRWFPKGMHVYVSPNTTSEKSIHELRETVYGISSIFGSAMIFKNLYNSMRIAPIMEAFPNACFIVCNRNNVDIAQSILNGRIKALGNKSEWWSLPPKEIDEIKNLPYWEQIVDQIYYTYKQIFEDKRKFGEKHFLEVNYEDLCRDTHGTLNKIESFLESKGYDLEIKGEVPESFPLSSGIKVDEEDYRLIVNEVEKRCWDLD